MVDRKSAGRGARPYVPKPDQEAIRKGVPSTRRSYVKDGVPIYKHRPGTNKVRFLAWRDKAHFIYYLYVHRGIGVNNDTFACLDKHRKGACPLCREAKKLLDQGMEWKEVLNKGLLPGKWPRMIGFVVDRLEEGKGVQLWDASSFETDDAIKRLSVDDDTGAVISWTDPDEGYDFIYEYDTKEQYPTPKMPRKSSRPSQIDIEFYRSISNIEQELIYWPAPKEINESYFAVGEITEEETAEEPEPEGGPDEPEEERIEKPAGGGIKPADPLAEAGIQDCLEKAFGFYAECKDAKEPCKDAEACEQSKKWTGKRCPTCNLPTFTVKEGETCALNHLQKKEEEVISTGRRRRPA